MSDIETDILSNDDATLLLHLAGELGQVERQSLEARLASDPSLRARLEALAGFDARMRGEAAIRPLTEGDSRRALAESLRLVREQAMVLQDRPHMRIGGRRLGGIPRWAWGSAVAACIAVGLVVWITNSEPTALKSSTEFSANVDETGVGGRQQVIEMAAAFVPIESADVEEGAAEINAQIDTQVDALNLLAVMNEPE